MRYGTEEALQKTLERARALRERRFWRQQRALAVGAGSCFCALLGLGYGLAARYGMTLEEADYGSFLLSSRAGGYVLVGVLAFIAGVVVTLLCLRYQNRGADPPVDGARSRKVFRAGEDGHGSPDSRAEQAKIIEEKGEGPAERRTTR